MIHENDSSIFSTSDLALATALSLRFPIDAIDSINPRKAQFFFKRNEDLDKAVESFWRRELKVEPQAYFDQLKAIKSRLYSREGLLC